MENPSSPTMKTQSGVFVPFNSEILILKKELASLRRTKMNPDKTVVLGRVPRS
jgi:hypothetical protein